jgi:putative sterol carrier protein
VQLVVQEVVTGGPDGEIRYVVAIDLGRTELRPGDHPAPDVTFVVDWDTAVAVATGSTSAQDAFTTGRLQLRGDVTTLLRHGRALAGLETVFAGLRETTTY